MSRLRPIFYSVSAQPDNLGDIEIRKTVLDWLKDSGRPLVVFVGPMPSDYLAGFGNLADVEIHSRSVSFERRLLFAACRGRATLVLAPGPQIFGPAALAVRSLINLVNVLAVRSRGGSAVAVGRSLRGGLSLGRVLDRFLIKLFSLYTVRDDLSSQAIGLNLRQHPDMAFAHVDTSPSEGDRNLLALSFRSDRAVPLELLSRLVETARAEALEPVLVSQVRRDDPQHRQLGNLLGVRTALWEDRTHLQQDEVVRGIYRRSLHVLSNRLHALIMGMQCGALPVAFTEAGQDKLTSTLRGVVTTESWPESTRTDDQPGPWLTRSPVSAQERLTDELHTASERLRELRQAFLDVL
ncbi:polysaccharide pyruvyl transferase family protein [Frigoribacterium sp. CFBP 13605]|uniref:polysaccharide pyruvyl transferase family protein n=1 Tax=Frigoribacterium sp. CFBP 13605 TaxID=2774034 RepID=UPI0019068D3B|nr:polysaccharide pyruvyl transferase family protein [Frigoribacterium sp. CFBP 13605]MBD8140025.1 polysaccharide pyruvyl transferase family protein [Frigoribacterium sp. CFBP 13605]